jgi:hypothetical protein
MGRGDGKAKRHLHSHMETPTTTADARPALQHANVAGAPRRPLACYS